MIFGPSYLTSIPPFRCVLGTFNFFHSRDRINGIADRKDYEPFFFHSILFLSSGLLINISIVFGRKHLFSFPICRKSFTSRIKSYKKRYVSYRKCCVSYGKRFISHTICRISYEKQCVSYEKRRKSYEKRCNSYGKRCISYGKRRKSYGKWRIYRTENGLLSLLFEAYNPCKMLQFSFRQALIALLNRMGLLFFDSFQFPYSSLLKHPI